MYNVSMRKMNELSKKRKKGFTLIELIIVIAIIAIIAAIAIPKFGQIKENSNITSDQANAKIIATAVAQAVSDGVDPTPGTVTNASNFITYIDGGKVPAAKSKNATGFSVAYSANGAGTVITLTGSSKQVYPVS